jgi:hypothetical protein
VHAGVPSVIVACEGFVEDAIRTCESNGVLGLPVARYPGHNHVDAPAVIRQKTRDFIIPAAIKAWTEKAEKVTKLIDESEPRDIIFTGNFNDVNKYFYEKQWGDGLPIIPPTLGNVDKFLQYTPLSYDTVLGVLNPANCQATVWNVAVNGVMAGCRPELMPVLVAIVQCLAEPKFNLKDAGSTGGWEVMVILSGPLMQQLNFNCGVAMLRAGNQANISVARFTRLYLRNVAGFLPGVADMSTYGQTYFPRVIVEDRVNNPWQPFSVDRGFKVDSNVVTVQGQVIMGKHMQPTAETAEEMLDKICQMMVYDAMEGGYRMLTSGWGPMTHDTLVISGIIAKKLAEQYTKEQVKQYIWEHARLTAKDLESRKCEPQMNLKKLVENGQLPKIYYENDDPNRLVPIYHNADELFIIVAGYPTRNRCFSLRGAGRMGLAAENGTKELQLPNNWRELI